jgi:hypothetical protein
MRNAVAERGGNVAVPLQERSSGTMVNASGAAHRRP